MKLSGLFFRRKIEKQKYSLNYYEQDPTQSIVTPDGKYDLKHFSRHEIEIIHRVLQAESQYPPEHRALGLINECFSIKYKPQYVLNEICVQRYGETSHEEGLLAVALAYASKGAIGRKPAIKYFEKVNINRISSILSQFAALSPLQVFTLFMELYEKEHQYQKAISCAEMARLEGGSRDYFKEKIAILQNKLKTPPVVRNRKPSADTLAFEEDVKECAKRFIKCDFRGQL